MSPRSSIVVTSVAFAVAACAKSGAPEPRVVQTHAVVAPAIEREADPRVAAGTGVTLMKDDLEDATRAIDSRDRYPERLARIRAVLGSEGEPISGGVAFRGVGPKNQTGPFDCFELAVLERVSSSPVISVDRRLCGLPYGDDTSKPYAGTGPRFTVARLQRIFDDLKNLPADEAEGMARARLGSPDPTPPALTGALAWFAIGPRSSDAPVTCHALLVPAMATPRIDPRPLADCGLAWPPPAQSFVRDENAKLPQATAPDDECKQRCTVSDVCIARRATEARSVVARRGDELFAYRYDGRPAHVMTSTTCLPVPASCGNVPALACINAAGHGCANDDEDSIASSFGRTTNGNGMWTLVCTTRRKKP